MKIEIYQINTLRDPNNLCFMNLDFWEKQNIDQIPAQSYDKVFAGKVPCNTLEDVYRVFNTEPPTGYTGRSLSVSDIVRVKSSEPSVKKGCYFCDSVGFKRVDFRYTLARKFPKERDQAIARALGITSRQLRARQYDESQLLELEKGLASRDNIHIYADPSFSAAQMKMIRLDLKENRDVSAYAKPIYDIDQMRIIREGVENGVDVSQYADHRFDWQQMTEIYLGLKSGVDVSRYADLQYNYRQMLVIRHGLEQKLNVCIYANPEYDAVQMDCIRRGLKEGLDVFRYADPSISAAEMFTAMEQMLEQPPVQEQQNMKADQKTYTIQQIADAMHKVNVNAMQGGVTEFSFRCGNDQIDIQGYTIEAGWESFEGSTAVWENGHLLYRRGAAHVDDYRQETYTLGQYPEYSEMVSYLQDKYQGKAFDVVKEKVPEVQESFERHWRNPAYQKSLEAAQAKKDVKGSSLQEIVSSAKEYAQKNPEKLVQKNSPPSRGMVR